MPSQRCPQVCLHWTSGMGSGVCSISCCVSDGLKPLWSKRVILRLPRVPSACQPTVLPISRISFHTCTCVSHEAALMTVCEGCRGIELYTFIYSVFRTTVFVKVVDAISHLATFNGMVSPTVTWYSSAHTFWNEVHLSEEDESADIANRSDRKNELF